MLKRRIITGLALLHFGVIVLYNLLSTSHGYQQLYGHHSQNERLSALINLMQRVSHLSPINFYAQLSGAETGYGFFAPQVGSQYISIFKLYDQADQLVLRTNAPGLNQSESHIRYSGYLDLYQAMLFSKITNNNASSDSLNIRYAKAILYSMSQQVLQQNPTAARVHASVYLVRTPVLRAFDSRNASQYIPIYEITIPGKP